jgi:site-specific DNA recombinase
MEKEKCVGYLRVSTSLQAETGESLEIQENAVRNEAKRINCDLIHIFRDEGFSGSKADRPALNELRALANKHAFQVIIFKKLTRFGRNLKDILHLYDELEGLGIKIYSIDEQFIDGTKNGRLMLGMIGSFGEFERKTIAEQTKAGLRSRLKKGETFVGHLPFGYQFNKETKKIEEVPEQKTVYLRIVDMFLNQYLSINEIALRLNYEGLGSPTGKRWTTITLGYILRNPAYTGKKVIMQQFYRMEGRRAVRQFKKDENGNKVRAMRPENDWITLNFPEFISELTYNEILKRIEFNKKKAKNLKYKNEFLASGLLQCGICGGSVSLRNGMPRKDGSQLHYYSCYWSKCASKQLELHNKKRCPLPTIKMSEVDAFLWNKILSLLTEPEENLKKFLTESSKAKTEIEERIKTIESQIKKMEKQISNLTSSVADAETDDLRKTFQNRLKEILKERSEIGGELSRLKGNIATLEREEFVLNDKTFNKYKNPLRKVLHAIPFNLKRQITATLVAPERGGKLIIRPLKAIDFLDYGDIIDGKIKPIEEIEGSVVLDMGFSLAGDKVLGVINLLRHNGFLSNKLYVDGSNHLKGISSDPAKLKINYSGDSPGASF